MIPSSSAPHAVEMPSKSKLLLADSIVFYGVLSLLMFGPLAFGGVDPWAVFFLETMSAILFITWICRQLFSADHVTFWSPVFAPMCAFVFLILLQLVLKKSAYPYSTMSGLELYIAYGLLCFLMTQSLRSLEQIKILASAFSIYGLAVAAFGLIEGLSPNGKIYWLRVPHSGGWIYGPYVNHNHYAGLMEMLFPIPLVLFMTGHTRGGQRILIIVAASLMITTIFLSGSRGGMAAFVVQVVSLFAILIWQTKTRTKYFRHRWPIAILVAVLAGLLAWVGSDFLKERLVGTSVNADLSTEMRLQIDRDVIKMLPRRPLLGWGLGTFGDVYPQFRSFPTSQSIDEAHNTYLQMLIETGAAGFAVGAWFIAVVFIHSYRGLRGRNHTINRSILLAGTIGVVGILVHSFVDFNLEIPANAALFYVLCTVVSFVPAVTPSL